MCTGGLVVNFPGGRSWDQLQPWGGWKTQGIEVDRYSHWRLIFVPYHSMVDGDTAGVCTLPMKKAEEVVDQVRGGAICRFFYRRHQRGVWWGSTAVFLINKGFRDPYHCRKAMLDGIGRYLDVDRQG